MNQEEFHILNQSLTNKLMTPFLNKDYDIVQLFPQHVKLHRVDNNSTYIVTKPDLVDFDMLFSYINDHSNDIKTKLTTILEDNDIMPSDGIMIEDIGEDIKQIFVQRIFDNYNYIINNNIDIVDDNLFQMVGPFTEIERRLFSSYDVDGNEINVDESPDAFIVSINDIFLTVCTDHVKQVNTLAEKWYINSIPLAGLCRKISSDGIPTSKKYKVAAKIDDIDEMNVSLDNIQEFATSNVEELNESMIVESIANGNACAQRRMKLFDAAKHYGAKIVDSQKWIAAVCYTYEQCHVFGRLKPKVKSGTNEIDPACNLEDWEGITPENKAKRDDWQLTWVLDGINDGYGKSFDKLSGESGQPRKSFGCETAWCNCGVLNGDGTWIARDSTNMYFNYYSQGGKTPYLILMDKSRGALYQYVDIMDRNGNQVINFLNEDDKIDGGNVGNPSDAVQMKFFDDFCKQNADFKKFIDDLDAKYYAR